MNYKFNIMYPILIAVLVLSHVISLVFSGTFGNIDMLIVAYFVIYDMIDEDNYIVVSVIFGLFADYIRGGFFGPAIMIFLIFSYVRFKAELVMDMKKFNSKILLFALMSYIYCSFNLFLGGYADEIIVLNAAVRTALNVGVAVAVIKVAGKFRAVENS